MAMVAPMPVTTHPRNSFGYRRGSDLAINIGSPAHNASNVAAAAAPPASRRPPLTTLENIAAELQFRLSTSPSADFGYQDGHLYGESAVSLHKSRSLPPNFAHNRPKSSINHKTPLRKAKSVRFADTQGLPLVAAVHQLTLKDSSYTASKIVPYDDQDDILSRCPLMVAAPNKGAQKNHSAEVNRSHSVPSSFNTNSAKPTTFGRKESPPLIVSPTHKHTFLFTQPSLEPDFFERVKQDNVVLESIREEPRSLHGIVRVSNIAFSKEVTIRWTHDGWRSSHDTCCVFCSNDGSTDRFAFELPINGDDVSFAIRYRVEGTEYWDNNRSQNYTVTAALRL